jgi:hypothetical protein
MEEKLQLGFENAQIGFRNFTGAEGPYNKEGDRSFVIFMDEARAKELEEQGWNIKWPKDQTDEEDTRQPYLPVSVGYRFFPPKVVLIADDNKTMLGQEEVGMLDWAEIKNADIVVRPYNWTVNGSSGIKAYLKAAYITIVTDQFASKYGM